MAPTRLADGSIEALKWLGLLLMVLDHVNTYLLAGRVVPMYAAGRVVMPLFSALLACNLARGTPGAAWRTARRAVLFGLLATPAFWALHGSWWPLNIMFTLAAGVAAIALLQAGQPLLALSLGLAAGYVVEFWWPAIGATVAAWAWWRSPSWRSALAWCACMALVCVLNGDAWAFAVVPLVAAAARLPVRTRRLRWAFYAAYPAHLFLLWGLQSTTPP